MRIHVSILLATLLVYCISCQENKDTPPPVTKQQEQNIKDTLEAKRALNELVAKIIASPIYNQYDSLRTELSFEKRIAYDEYLMTRKQNNTTEIIGILNNNNTALGKKREALLKLGFKLSYQYERVSVAMMLVKTKLLNAFPELLKMPPEEQEQVLQSAIQKKSRALISPI